MDNWISRSQLQTPLISSVEIENGRYVNRGFYEKAHPIISALTKWAPNSRFLSASGPLKNLTPIGNDQDLKTTVQVIRQMKDALLAAKPKARFKVIALQARGQDVKEKMYSALEAAGIEHLTLCPKIYSIRNIGSLKTATRMDFITALPEKLFIGIL